MQIRLQSRALAHRVAKTTTVTTKSQKKKNRKNKNKKITTTQQVITYTQALPPVTSDSLLCEAYLLLCRGFTRIVAALTQLGFKVDVLNPDPDYREKWFVNRFYMFHVVPQPRPLTMTQYEKQQTQFKAAPATELLKGGCQAYTRARTLITKAAQIGGKNPASLENLLPNYQKTLNSLKLLAVTNSILHLSVGKVLGEAEKHQVEYDFSLDARFPVIKVVPIPAKIDFTKLEEKKAE